MNYAALREAVARGNVALGRSGLVALSFGNLSVVDRDAGVMAIKPSGMAYADLEPEAVPIVSLADGEVVDGSTRPSTDTPTHLALYREFTEIGAVVHTHSPYATAWAQAGRPIPCLGTTHADHFHGQVPVSRMLLPEEINLAYEEWTGRAIVERFQRDGISPADFPGVLAAAHGVFTWGSRGDEALEHAIALEHIAEIATHQAAIGPLIDVAPTLRDWHYKRKHGAAAYYGQKAAAAAGKR